MDDHPTTPLPRMGDEPAPPVERAATRHEAIMQFLCLWILLHCGNLLLMAGSGFFWPLVALITMPMSYRLLLKGRLTRPGTLGLVTTIGSIIGLLLADGRATTDLISMARTGFLVGMLSLPLLPWRGLRSCTWPIMTTLGWSAAWAVVHVSGADVGRLIGAGAVYGLLTGPVLDQLLDEDAHQQHSLMDPPSSSGARPG